MAMKNPPHPGLLIRDDVMAPLGLSLVDAATKFEVEAKYLSAVTEGREPVSAALAVNLGKARLAQQGRGLLCSVCSGKNT